ncbi:hypothetical protein A5634_10150 [Mycobacterium asiaticum]|uniref:Alcohol dehydrogenase-like C-terminal domain-containing protein n=1 Tax=Mycobacterium asiaticum TaxID=1790 RepID=A0A1A3NM14_MYCAS|nr:hypothetical protein A5634_10150 [Mycobacterium asiaticum]
MAADILKIDVDAVGRRGDQLGVPVVGLVVDRRIEAELLGEQGTLVRSTGDPDDPRAFGNLLVQRATLQGFIVLDHFGRAAEAAGEIAGLITEGKLTPLETIVEGFEQLPTAINMLFDGKNVGKLMVKLNG